MTNNNEPNDENNNPDFFKNLFEQILPLIGGIGDKFPPGFGTTDDFHRDNGEGRDAFDPQEFIERFGSSLPEQFTVLFGGNFDPEQFAGQRAEQPKPAASKPSEPTSTVVNVDSTADGFPPIYVPVPGFSKSQILVELMGSTLNISTVPNEKQTYLKELNFKYLFSHNVSPQNLDVHCENGLLIIKVKDENQSFGIPVK